MSEETTQDLSDSRSFEERVFARFDALDARSNAMGSRFDARFDALDARFDRVEARFDRVEARLDRVEAQLDSLDIRVQALEAKALDTKPIWERALAEILEVKQRVESIERKFDVLALDMMQLRGDQRGVGKRMDALESRPQ